MVITTANNLPPSSLATTVRWPRRALVTLLILTAFCLVVVGWRPIQQYWRPEGQNNGIASEQPRDVSSSAHDREVGTGAESVSDDPPQRANGERRNPRTSEPRAPVSAAGYIWPTSGVITQEFGCTNFELEPWNAVLGCRFHYGIDIANVSETPILAAKAGQVVFAGWQEDGYGYRVLLVDSEGVQTLYAHLCCSPELQTGQNVSQGERIGLMGTTGASSGTHLHFAVEVNGVAIDPREYLPEGAPVE